MIYKLSADGRVRRARYIGATHGFISRAVLLVILARLSAIYIIYFEKTIVEIDRFKASLSKKWEPMRMHNSDVRQKHSHVDTYTLTN